METETAEAARLVGVREVDDPWYSDGLYYGTHPDKRASQSKIRLEERPVTRIGALAFIRAAEKSRSGEYAPNQHGRRYPHHERAAELFKSMYEGLYGGTSPAVDPSKEPVDTSARAHDAGMASRIDRGLKLALLINGLPAREDRAAVPALLTKTERDVLIDMLIFCTPCSEYADVMPSGQRNQRQIAAMEQERLAIVEKVAVHWGFESRRGQ